MDNTNKKPLPQQNKILKAIKASDTGCYRPYEPQAGDAVLDKPNAIIMRAIRRLVLKGELVKVAMAHYSLAK